MLELLVNLLCSRKIARNWCTLEKKVVVSMADSPLRDDAMLCLELVLSHMIFEAHLQPNLCSSFLIHVPSAGLEIAR